MKEVWTRDQMVRCMGGWAINFKGGHHPLVETRKQFEAMMVRVLEHGDEPGWQDDMDAAPKDGTDVDLWVPGLGRMADFHWQKYVGGAHGGAFECWAGRGWFGPLHLQYPASPPTHWRHRPAGPEVGT